MLPFLQHDTLPDNALFLLSYQTENCIKPLYFNEIGAQILRISAQASADQNISAQMNPTLKKYMKNATLFDDPVCCCIADTTSPETKIHVKFLLLHAFKQNNSSIILGKGFTSQQSYKRMVGVVPWRIFEDLVIANPDYILFGMELDSDLELTLTCYGPAIHFLLDFPLPNIYEEKIQLKAFLAPSNYYIIRSHALQCFNSGVDHSFVYCKESDTSKKYYSVRMIGDLHNGQRTIYGTAVDITYFVNQQQNVYLLHQNILNLFDSFDEAACTVFIRVDSPPIIESQSKKFAELLKLNPELPFHLLTLRVCNHLQLNNTPLNFKQTLKISTQKKKDFDITITPFYKETQGTLVIISALLSSPPLPLKQQITEKLTPREQQVIKFVLNGEKNLVIACHLNITEGTVKRIISNVYKKLHVRNRTELIKQFLITK